jgi:protein-tyrosine phosphatase
VIDLHTHVLPGLDDGPASMDASFVLARAAVAAGTTTMVATPHIDYAFEVDPAEVGAAVERLQAELTGNGVDLTLRAGGEIATTRLPDLSAAELDLLHLGDGPYLLLETPHGIEQPGFDSYLFELRLQGLDMVLAHPERCPTFQRDPDGVARLVGAGALSAVTASSLSGKFGRTVREVAFTLLERGLVHALVSDAHDIRRRPPDLTTGFAAAEERIPGISAELDWLVNDAPEAILSGRPLPPRPPRPARAARRRSWWSRRTGR